METTSAPTTRHPGTTTTHGRAAARLKTIIAPPAAPAGSPERRIHLARQAVLAATVLLTLVQVVIWMMIAIATGHLDAPWWLWTVLGGGLALFALTTVEWLRTGYQEKG